MSGFHLAAALGASSLLALAPIASQAEAVRLEVVPMQKQQELWSPVFRPQPQVQTQSQFQLQLQPQSQIQPRVDPWLRLPAALQQGPSLPRSLQVDPYPEGIQRL
ncbi:MAG: hypothetical protein ACOYLI_10825 [Synechococcus lacustris]|jgi:hypothetical protein